MAIFSAMQALVDEGDKVLVFEPYWPWYLPCIRLAGGVPVTVRLEPPSFSMERTAVTKAFEKHRPKVVVVNTPHNPTGKVATADDLAFISDLCLKHDTIAISDEVYENVTFKNRPHFRLCDLPDMFEVGSQPYDK